MNEWVVVVQQMVFQLVEILGGNILSVLHTQNALLIHMHRVGKPEIVIIILLGVQVMIGTVCWLEMVVMQIIHVKG